jgi:diguanylate cyclase (GGDEF)-like protein
LGRSALGSDRAGVDDQEVETDASAIDDPAPNTGDPARPTLGLRFSNRARVRSLLLVVVLIPTLAMVVLSASSARETWDRREASATVEHDARRLESLMATRALLTHEEVNSLVLLIGGELGAGPDRLSELYGIDFEQELREARSLVDADPTFQTDPALETEREALRSLRSSVDDGTATSDVASRAFVQLGADIDEMWASQFERLDQTVAAAALPGEFGVRLEDLEHAHSGFIVGLSRTGDAIDVLGGDTSPETTRRLIEANTNFRTRAAELEHSLGPRGAAALAAFREDPAAIAFERTTEQAITATLTGVPDPAWADPTAYGNALFDGVGWSNALIEVVSGASADLSAMAAQQQADAARDFRTGVAFTVLLTVLSLLGANHVARSVSRPLKELASNARSIREGRLDVDPVDVRGPRELADTAAAFNEMVVALTAVEARAVAMAGDAEASEMNTPIPGRTGEALDRAFGLLRESIRSAEASRAELHDLATHDGMTGLLNRTAAMDAISRDLERVQREGGSLVVLFVDVDGLKEVNDAHGHDAGDDLIRLTADTLRSTARRSDVVARLGGDEFLVAARVSAEVRSVESETGLGTLAQRLTTAIGAASVERGDVRIPLRASIGMAVNEPGELTADGIIRRADAAMYRAKHDATTSMAWYDPDAVDPGPLGRARPRSRGLVPAAGRT